MDSKNAGIEIRTQVLDTARSLVFFTFKTTFLFALLCLVVIPVGLAAEANEETQQEQLLPEPVADIEPTVVASEEYYDPFEGFNRKVFAFNDVVYRALLIPLSRGYVAVLPDPVRQSVAGVFGNLREPLNLINHSLQGEFSNAGTNLLRFLTNSSLGIFGLFDPADSWFGLSDTDTSFNETLIRYRVGQGPYLVLPILGPSDVRNTTSSVTQSLAHPLRYLTESPETTYYMVFDNFQAFTPSANAYVDLSQESEDPYTYFRNQYLQGVDRNEQLLGEEE